MTRYLLPTDGGEPPSEPPSEPLRGLHVLDLGAGQGRNGVHLAGLGATVTAVDSSAVGLRKAALLASQRGVPASRLQTRLADLDAYRPGPSSCDVILCIFCALPPEPRARLLARWRRMYDAEYDCDFFFDSVTGVATWDEPRLVGVLLGADGALPLAEDDDESPRPDEESPRPGVLAIAEVP